MPDYPTNTTMDYVETRPPLTRPPPILAPPTLAQQYMPSYNTAPNPYGTVCNVQTTQAACIAMSIPENGKLCTWDPRKEKCTPAQGAP